MARYYKSKAMRLTDEFLRDIWNNCYAQDCHLPSEETLAARYKCSRMTMRKILTSLAADGILVKIPSCGTRINPQLDLPEPPRPEQTSQKKIAAVMAAFPDILTIEVNRGIHDYALQNDISFMLLQNTDGPAALAKNLEQLRTTDIAGIIWFGTDAQCNTRIKTLAERGFPIVCVDNPIEGSSIPYIGVDNFGGMYTAVSELLRRTDPGVYYIGYCTECTSQQERYRGYCAAMRDHGLAEKIPEYTIVIPQPDASGQYLDPEQERLLGETAAKLLSSPLPLGVAAECDYIARTLLKTAETMRLTPGKDLFLIGFDDLPQAEKMGLSSVRQPRYELGFEAAQLLDRLICGHKADSAAKLFPVTLKLRSSSGH